MPVFRAVKSAGMKHRRAISESGLDAMQGRQRLPRDRKLRGRDRLYRLARANDGKHRLAPMAHETLGKHRLIQTGDSPKFVRGPTRFQFQPGAHRKSRVKAPTGHPRLPLVGADW